MRDEIVPGDLQGVELGDDVLEIGPGPGVTTDVLRSRVPRLTAIEIEARLAESLRARLPSERIEVVTGDAASSPARTATRGASASAFGCCTSAT